LLARRFDSTKRVLIGDPIPVADSVAFQGGSSSNAAGVATSAAGLVAYRAGEGNQTQLTWFDRAGKILGTFGARDDNWLFNPEFSPDSRQVAVRRTVQNNTDVWILDGARAGRFTYDAGDDQYPVWSPNGEWVAFVSQKKGKGVHDLYRRQASGVGTEELLLDSPQNKSLDDWSPDGRLLLFNVEDPITGRDLWVLPLEGDRKPFAFLKTSFQEHRGQFSPDGKWIAYVSNESGGPTEIYVRPFPDAGGGRWLVSTAGGIQPRWSRDGRELYYLAPDGKLMATPIAAKDTAVQVGTPVALFETRVPFGAANPYNRPQYDVTADGRFLVNVTSGESTISPITLLLNWNAR
jgi:dipeptidyl aminopeptidase/acylaminoacyl peptidase